MAKIYLATLTRPDTGPGLPRPLNRGALQALLATLRIGDKLRIERTQ